MNLEKIRKRKYWILCFLISISLLSSIFLSINELKPTPLICDVTEGCFIVSNSEYSETLGVENAYIGLAFFAVLFSLIVSQIRKPQVRKGKLITLGVIIGGIWAIYSLYLMEFVIGAYCKYCTAIDISALIAVAVILVLRK